MPLALTIGALIVCVALATALSRPATERTRDRSRARRAAFVSAHPTRARIADVVAALRREGLDAAAIEAVLRRAEEQDASPGDLWVWFERFGVDHLDQWPLHADGQVDGESPAAESSLPAADAAREPRHRASLPEVHDPGTYPGLLVPRRGRVRLGDNVRRDGGSDHSAA